MSTLADILVSVPPSVWLDRTRPVIRIREQILRGISGVPVIVVNEVSRYFFDVLGIENEPRNEDFPNIAPPFSEFWIEYKVPKTVMFGHPRRPTPLDFGGQRVGFFWYTEPRLDGRSGWQLISLMFAEHEGWAAGPLFSVRLDADPEGRLVDFTGNPVVEGRSATGDSQLTGEEAEMFTLHYPAVLAICFMHCNNVRLVDNRTKEAHARKHQRLYGRAPIVYKTLDIAPMRKIIRSEGGPHCGLRQALHIMRGHFKRFEERPLFGKHKGMWWWSSQLRGALERGYVKKTYEVHPPKDEPSKS